MFKKTLNEIADLDKPLEYLVDAAEKVSRELSVSLDHVKQLIADKFGIYNWYQLERQLASTASQRRGGKELFQGLQRIRQCIQLSKFDRSKLSGASKELLAMKVEDCMNLPEYFQDHLSDISFTNEFNEYLRGEDANVHQSIIYWDDYSKIRIQKTLAEQLCEFVRFKINTQSLFSSGDLLDKHSGMHMYARCHPDGSGLSLSEFWCCQSPRISLADHENFVKQSYHVIEDTVLKIPVSLGIIDVTLHFKSVDGERFYRDVFLKSRIKNLLHKKTLFSDKFIGGTAEELTIRISLSC